MEKPTDGSYFLGPFRPRPGVQKTLGETKETLTTISNYLSIYLSIYLYKDIFIYIYIYNRGNKGNKSGQILQWQHLKPELNITIKLKMSTIWHVNLNNLFKRRAKLQLTIYTKNYCIY